MGAKCELSLSFRTEVKGSVPFEYPSTLIYFCTDNASLVVVIVLGSERIKISKMLAFLIFNPFVFFYIELGTAKILIPRHLQLNVGDRI
jgi:hypothetical protein